MSESYLDNPAHDGTHKQHPAFRRGQLAGTINILRIIKAVSEGTDIGDGKVGSPQIEAARRIVLELMNNVQETSKASTAPSKKAQKALEAVEELVKEINI